MRAQRHALFVNLSKSSPVWVISAGSSDSSGLLYHGPGHRTVLFRERLLHALHGYVRRISWIFAEANDDERELGQTNFSH
jgi:hypothetical protein